MSRFQVSREDEFLELAMPIDFRHVALGGILFLISLLCSLVLGMLALTQEAMEPRAGPSGSGPLGIAQPQAHPFGFLWVLSTIVIAILIPVYGLRIRRSGVTYRLDRASGLLLKNGRELMPLSRIECVGVRRMVDSDGGHWYRLSIEYADGHEIFLEDSYDSDEVNTLARDIAEYAERPVVRR